ncbi:60S ribosomal protein L29 [Plecturocebus cupreus]
MSEQQKRKAEESNQTDMAREIRNVKRTCATIASFKGSHEPGTGVDPKFLRSMCFAKKHNKKGLEKMQANNAKTMSARAEAIKALVKTKEVKPKIPKGVSHKLN